MALYDELAEIDIVTPILRDHKIRYTKEGDPVIALESVYVDSPWIHHRVYGGRQCSLWHIYFNKYGIVPLGCRSCWKVVMAIKTLDQLMHIKEVQKTSKYNCKCGLETRPVTGGLGEYRAFWYAPLNAGLAGGREMFKDLQKQFPGVKIILKRGCTEFESRYYPSGSWDVLAEEQHWNLKEELLNTLFAVQETRDKGTPSVIEPSVIRKWIEWAYEHHKATGDQSCFKYMEEAPIKPPMTYHSSQHEAKYYLPSTMSPKEIEGQISYAKNNSTERSQESEAKNEDGGFSPKIVQFKDLET